MLYGTNLYIYLSSLIFCFLILSLVVLVLQKNPISMIFSFIGVAIFVCIFLMLWGAEFLCLLIIIIYTGIIAVLFLFTVIIYNLRELNLSESLSFIFNPFFYFVLYRVHFSLSKFLTFLDSLVYQNIYTNDFFILDVSKFVYLFIYHLDLFLLVGLLLFIAIVGAVVITQPFYKTAT